MKKIFTISNNKNKLENALNIYTKLLDKNNNRSKNILVLVPNNATKLTYEKNINTVFSEELNITTYISFIKKELIKFWPLVSKDCDKIKGKTISPTFISSSLTDYMLQNKVKSRRNLDGYFQDLTSTNRNIAMSINTNINKAASALIDFRTVGEKIYLSKKNRDNIDRFSYSQMNEIINYYVDTLLENAIIDNSLCIYLYNNYLLENELYIKNFKKNVEYIIVDSLEACSTAEVDFINLVQLYANESYIYFNKTRDYSVFNNIDMDYIYENIISSTDIKVSTDELNINKEESQVQDKVLPITFTFDNNISVQDLYLLDVKINLNESSQLYSEMIEEVINKVIQLVSNGVQAKDIAIISPINNNVLDYQIVNKLNSKNIEVFNSKKDKKIIDYPYSNALVVATCIFYGYTEHIKEEEYISFIEILLNTNRIQAFKIFRNKDESEKLQNLLKYIENKKDKNLKISEFLIQFYIEKMLNLSQGKENINTCKMIIHESDVFTENISKLGLDKNNSKEKIFIDVLKSIIKDYYSIHDLQELNNSNKVVITTPYSYISSNMDRLVQIWVDIGSNAWNMKIEKDISNVIVLRKSFKENRIYTDIMEEQYKKYYLYNMIYNLMINAKEVYAYKSEYTVNGYIQESILYSLLLKLVDKGDR